jgi:hypothetical protein
VELHRVIYQQKGAIIMAGVLLNVNSGEVALAAATAKTALQIKAATNQRVLINSLRFLGKAPAGGTDTPIKIRMTRSTANFGTGTGATPAKNDPSDAETVQTSASSNFSAEPTAPVDGGLWWEVQPQAGIEEFLPPGQQIKIPGGQSVNFECTSPGTPTLLIVVGFEE